MSAFVKLTDETVESRAETNIAIPNNTWFHAAATWNQTFITIYYNGELKASVLRSNTPVNLVDNMTDTTIGSGEQNIPTSNYWNGSIDEVQIYNGSFTPTQIKQLYQGQLIKMGLNSSETSANSLYNATITLYDNSTAKSASKNVSFAKINSCGYELGEKNWNINGVDGCVLSQNYKLQGVNLLINGSGTFRFNGFNITGLSTVLLSGTSSTEKLFVQCEMGGCFR